MTKRIPINCALLGLQLRNARHGAGLTLMEVANTTGVSYTQLSRIERGLFKHLSANVQTFCNAMHVYPAVEQTEAVSLNGRLTRALQDPADRRALAAFLDALDAAHMRS